MCKACGHETKFHGETGCRVPLDYGETIPCGCTTMSREEAEKQFRKLVDGARGLSSTVLASPKAR